MEDVANMDLSDLLTVSDVRSILEHIDDEEASQLARCPGIPAPTGQSSLPFCHTSILLGGAMHSCSDRASNVCHACLQQPLPTRVAKERCRLVS